MSIAQSEAADARKLPIINVSGLHGDAIDRRVVARELRLACTNTGFFYITGHGVPTAQIDRVFQQSRAFFALRSNCSAVRIAHTPTQVRKLARAS